VLRSLAAAAAAVALAAACSIGVEPHPKSGLGIDWAQTDDAAAVREKNIASCESASDCIKTPHPTEIWITPGHQHAVMIAVSGTSPLHGSVSGDVAVYVPPEAGNDCAYLKGSKLGFGDLTLETEDHRQVSTTHLRGVSHRVSVIAWVDGAAIHPDDLARGHSATVERALRTDKSVEKELLRLLLWAPIWAVPGMPPPSLPFLTRPEDRTYAEAVLLKRSANAPPDRELSKAMLQNDYRLLNDFRVGGTAGSPFGLVLNQTTTIGSTPAPFSVPMAKAYPEIVAAFERPEVDQAMNGAILCSCGKSVTQVAQGRVGLSGQYVHRALNDWNRATGDATPWIWATISFTKSGDFSITTQVFPTYTVYVDGIRDDEQTSNQANLVDFLKLDHKSQVASNDGILRAGGCPCAK